MKKRIFKLIVTEVFSHGAESEGSMKSEYIEDIQAYLDFYKEKTKTEEGEKNVVQ